MWTIHIQVHFADSKKNAMKIVNIRRCVQRISDYIYKDFYFDKYHA